MSSFVNELEEVINKHCKENESNTPDFILAQYMSDCLDAFTKASTRREQWYGKSLTIEGLIEQQGETFVSRE